MFYRALPCKGFSGFVRCGEFPNNPRFCVVFRASLHRNYTETALPVPSWRVESVAPLGRPFMGIAARFERSVGLRGHRALSR